MADTAPTKISRAQARMLSRLRRGNHAPGTGLAANTFDALRRRELIYYSEEARQWIPTSLGSAALEYYETQNGMVW